MDLTEAEDIKKRWQEYTEELYKKDLHDQDYHNGVTLTQSQTSWNVKSSGPQKTSLRTKLVGVMEFQLSYFINILKDDVVKVLNSICQQIWKTQQWPLEKVSFHSNSKERHCQRKFKLLHICSYFTCQQSNAQNSSGQASTVYELRNSNYSNWIQKRHRNLRPNCQHPLDNRKSREFQKNIYFDFIDYTKTLDCVVHNQL